MAVYLFGLANNGYKWILLINRQARGRVLFNTSGYAFNINIIIREEDEPELNQLDH